MEFGRRPEEPTQFKIQPLDDWRWALVLLEPRFGYAQPVSLTEDRFRRLSLASRDHPSKQLRSKRHCPVPGSRRGDEEEADVSDQARWKAGGAFLRENVLDRIVIVKIAQRLNFQRRPVEPCAKSDLAGETPSRIGARRHHGAIRRVPPFHDSSVVAKPVHVLGRIVAFKADNRSNETDPIRWLRIAPVKIVLSELADHSIATE